MHTIESYATSLGLKIDKPSIYEKYYPVGDFKYITLYLGSNGNQAYYRHWQEVINLAFPILENKKIKIIQLNAHLEQKFDNCVNLTEPLEPNRLSYIIRKSDLHLTENGLDLEIASLHNKNIIYLDPKNEGHSTSPYWNKNSKYVYLNESEEIKDINKIKPEKICKYIFNFLDLNYNIDFETVFIGENYQSKIAQFVPDQNTDLGLPEQSMLIVRMDKFFDEQNLAKQLSKYKCIIITNKEINLNLLQQLKHNIHHIAYFVEENDNPEFVDSIQQMGVSFVLMSYLNEDEIKSKKINYIDNDAINHVKIPSKEDIEELKGLDINSLHYLSNGPVLSNFKVYKSIFDYEDKNFVENPSIPTQIKENEDFWKEINNFHIVKKTVDNNPN
tara:strand:+ start:2196 stop:3356 length:1161 start_codon:yes stop_codon:yes gene_type:complete